MRKLPFAQFVCSLITYKSNQYFLHINTYLKTSTVLHSYSYYIFQHSRIPFDCTLRSLEDQPLKQHYAGGAQYPTPGYIGHIHLKELF